VGIERLRSCLQDALSSGALTPPLTAKLARAFLRGRGLECTPSQAQTLVQDDGEHLLRGGVRSPQAATFGDRLRRLREAKGLTQGDVATLAEISASYMSLLEAGKREASPELAGRLARILEVERSVLSDGATSPTTLRIRDLLRFGDTALRLGDVGEAERCVTELFDPAAGRALWADELDQALVVRARCARIRGHHRRARADLDLVLPRVLARDSVVDPVALGEHYVRVRMELADGDVAELVDAVSVAQQLLALVDAAERTASWWRLTATIMEAYLEAVLPELAIAVGTRALADAEREAEEPAGEDGLRRSLHPGAAVLWILSLAELQRGRLEPAIARMTSTLDLVDTLASPLDRALVRRQAAYLLLLARPHQVDQARALLDECRGVLQSVSETESGGWWLTRARADLVDGHPERVEPMVRPVVDSVGIGPMVTIDGWLLIGDARAALRLADAAAQAYRTARDLLAQLPASRARSSARAWCDLAYRLQRVSDSGSAVPAFQRALASAGLPQMPGLPTDLTAASQTTVPTP
jgi:transcriptional regulator with XRE-family HTH domain